MSHCFFHVCHSPWSVDHHRSVRSRHLYHWRREVDFFLAAILLRSSSVWPPVLIRDLYFLLPSWSASDAVELLRTPVAVLPAPFVPSAPLVVLLALFLALLAPIAASASTRAARSSRASLSSCAVALPVLLALPALLALPLCALVSASLVALLVLVRPAAVVWGRTVEVGSNFNASAGYWVDVCFVLWRCRPHRIFMWGIRNILWVSRFWWCRHTYR